MSITLPPDWCQTERGNTWLFPLDELDRHALWIHLEGDHWMEVTLALCNFPAWNIQVVEITEKDLWDHIHAKLHGWCVRRWDLSRLPRTLGDNILLPPEGDGDE